MTGNFRRLIRNLRKMKTYIFTLTDEAKATPDKFFPAIQAIISNKGGFDIHLMDGCITANFSNNFEPASMIAMLSPINGVLAVAAKEGASYHG